MFKKLINRVKYLFSKERCFNHMKEIGNVDVDGCLGKAGGDHNTDYLDPKCIECQFLNSHY